MPTYYACHSEGRQPLSADPKFHGRTKHIDVQWRFVRERAEKDEVPLEDCPTNEMAADELTKPLEKVKIERFVRQVGLASSVLEGSDWDAF